ncbi:hypothetical protein WICPIJ_003023 [Wickerhamomyces pijperi]|uniref:6-phosphofructo-2-kinase domain-containing protein n=1 Tax=Wickerhamomyces pijperi TaxID=599730 RepID=A0A9P8Q8H8_WICPI|nr:hypothetical protein WICPIJ_003023 [Wickerhamomyces pijperi]
MPQQDLQPTNSQHPTPFAVPARQQSPAPAPEPEAIQAPKIPGNYSARTNTRWTSSTGDIVSDSYANGSTTPSQDGVHSYLSANHIFPAQLYSTESGRLFHAGKILIALVGLPARGKTHLSVSLTRYLRWLGVKTHPFHVSDYRRKAYSNFNDDIPADYFSATPQTEEGQALRSQIISGCLDDIVNFFEKDQGQVAIYDALNALKSHRQEVAELCERKNIKVLFVESIIDDEDLLRKNINNAVASPDYKGWEPTAAKDDYVKRIHANAPIYETMDFDKSESHLHYVKFINFGERLVAHNSQYGYLINRIVFFLMNSRIKTGRVYFARCGQSNLDKYIDDEELNGEGLEYSDILAKTLFNRLREKRKEDLRELIGTGYVHTPSSGLSPLITASNSHSNSSDNIQSAAMTPTTSTLAHQEQVASETSGSPSASRYARRHLSRQPSTADGSNVNSFVVWTATRKRTSETANPFRNKNITVRERYQLNQLNTGAIADMSTQEIIKNFEEDYLEDLKDPYHHRYPRAESYHDLAVRMEPLLLEMERMSGDILIIAHESVLRVLYGYLMACNCYEIPGLQFPRDELIEISFTPYQNYASRIKIPGVEV